MKFGVRLFTVIAACGLSVATAAAAGALSPSESSQAPAGANGAERTVQETLYDLDGLYLFPCSEDGEPLPDTDGELIDIEGQLYERITLLVDGAGGYHYSENTMPVGLRGVGLTSGEEFRIRESEQLISNHRLAGGSGMYRQELTLVGESTHRRFKLVSNGHYLIAADGTIKLSRDRLVIECRQ